jgi:hypothetical protein
MLTDLERHVIAVVISLPELSSDKMVDYDDPSFSDASDESVEDPNFDSSASPNGCIMDASGTPADGEGETSGDSASPEEPERQVKMSARAYQLEMLEYSLKRNIIIAVGP